MTPGQEAEALTTAISCALRELRQRRPVDLQESEVTLRFNTIENLLLIMLNDAIEMEKDWRRPG